MGISRFLYKMGRWAVTAWLGGGGEGVRWVAVVHTFSLPASPVTPANGCFIHTTRVVTLLV